MKPFKEGVDVPDDLEMLETRLTLEGIEPGDDLEFSDFIGNEYFGTFEATVNKKLGSAIIIRMTKIVPTVTIDLNSLKKRPKPPPVTTSDHL